MATGQNSSPTIREGLNLYRNWNTSLQNTLKHVCDPKTTKGQDDARKKHLTASELRQLVKKANSGDMSALAALSRSYDGKSGIGTDIRTKEEIEAGNKLVWKNTVDGFKTINNIRNKVGNAVLELLSVNDVYRLTTGKDPLTGEDASRLEAAGWLLVDLVTIKLGKLAKGLKATNEALRALDAINDASKAAKAADRAKDASKVAKAVDKASDAARVADKVDDVKDANKVVKSIDELSPKELQNMTLDEIKSTIPDNSGWAVYENNGFVHIKKNGVDRIKLDPPDKVTTYPHMHIYDENKNLLNIDGEIVGRKDPAGHIPWNNGR